VHVDLTWVPVATAVKRLNVSRQRVHQLIGLGQLQSVTMDGTVMVSSRSIDMRVLALGGRMEKYHGSG